MGSNVSTSEQCDGETGIETKALERLVKHDDDVDGGEFASGHSKGESDKDAVKDDAKLEDKSRC
jgi:hypothetical protein